jgi:hypothetical protein
MSYNKQISQNKTRILALNGKNPVRAKTVIDGDVIAQVICFIRVTQVGSPA